MFIGVGIGVGRNQTGDPPSQRDLLGFEIGNNVYSGNVASIGRTMDVRGLYGEVIIQDSHLDVVDWGELSIRQSARGDPRLVAVVRF